MISTDPVKSNYSPVTSFDDFVFKQVSPDQLVDPVIDSVRTIYLDSFPPFERVDFTDIVSDIVVERRQLTTVAYSENVIAFAVTLPLPNTKFTLLEYIAVQASRRDLGIGGHLLERVKASTRSKVGKLQTQGIILEVEEYREDLSEEERTNRERRMQFYFRHGAKRVRCAESYRIPNLETGIGTVPMTLLVIPFSNNNRMLSGSVLETCIRGIYQYSYGRRGDDATLRKTLEDLSC